LKRRSNSTTYLSLSCFLSIQSLTLEVASLQVFHAQVSSRLAILIIANKTFRERQTSSVSTKTSPGHSRKAGRGSNPTPATNCNNLRIQRIRPALEFLAKRCRTSGAAEGGKRRIAASSRAARAKITALLDDLSLNRVAFLYPLSFFAWIHSYISLVVQFTLR